MPSNVIDLEDFKASKMAPAKYLIVEPAGPVILVALGQEYDYVTTGEARKFAGELLALCDRMDGDR